MDKKQKKVERVMREYKHGELYSGSGHKVTSRDQAVAIAMHEAGYPAKSKKGVHHSPTMLQVDHSEVHRARFDSDGRAKQDNS